MTGDDWFFTTFMLILLASIASSIYLWFFRRLRSGMLSWLSYSVRALCGLLIFSAGIVASDLLLGQVDFSAVIPFVGIFFAVGVGCMLPWGLFSGSRNSKIREQV